jgi:MFS family permease
MAWFAVGAAAAMLAVIMGMLVNGLTAFFVPMEQAEGWARADIASINSFGLIGLAFGSVAMGYVADRLSIRAICLLAASTMGVCLIAASQAGSPWMLCVLFFLAGALAGGTLFAPIFAYVGNWFPSAAGVAIGVAAAGQAVGQGSVPLLAAWLIESFGWRSAMLALGCGTLGVLVPLAWGMRQAPTAAGASFREPELQPALAVPILSAAVFFCCTCMAVPLMHLMPLIQSLCISSTDAGSVMFVMLLAAIAGRIAYGKLCDKIGATRSWLVASALQTVGVLAFTQFGSLREFFLFSVVYGFAYAGVMTSILVAVRALTPARNKATWMGLVLSFAWLGHAFGGFQGAFAYDLTAGYQAGFAAGALAGAGNLILVGMLIWLTRPRARDGGAAGVHSPQDGAPGPPQARRPLPKFYISSRSLPPSTAASPAERPPASNAAANQNASLAAPLRASSTAVLA